jgi:hypothetical protein
MAKPPLDLLQGTLDLLILKTLSWGPAHGYAVARWIDQLTGEVLQLRAEAAMWAQFVDAVGRVLSTTEQPA